MGRATNAGLLTTHSWTGGGPGVSRQASGVSGIGIGIGPPVQLLLRLQLTLQVDEVAGKQTVDALDSCGEVGVGVRGEKIGLACDGELGLEAKEIAFGGSIELSLFRCGVAAVAVGDGAGGGKGRGHEAVGDDLGFALGRLACRSHGFGGQGDGFLPDLEVAN